VALHHLRCLRRLNLTGGVPVCKGATR